MNPSEELKLKQTYLREAIIDSGYNPDGFVMHLKSLRSNGDDINTWTLEELKVEAKSYKECYPIRQDGLSNIFVSKIGEMKREYSNVPQTNDEAKPNQKNPEIAKVEQKVNEVIPEENKSLTNIRPSDASLDSRRVCLLEQLQSSIAVESSVVTKKPERKTEDIKANISEQPFFHNRRTKIIDPGYFYYKYEVYGIDSSIARTRLYRSQADFNELSNAMKKLCPGYAIPPFSHAPIKKLDPEYINRRKAELQDFLSQVLEHPLLKQLDIVWQFLSVENEKDYEVAKKNMKAIPILTDISDFFTSNGEANVKYDDNLENRVNDIGIALNQIQTEFKKYINAFTIV